MAGISSKVLEKIEDEKIKPIGKWSFILKDSFVWTLFILNIIFGSVGFAISIYLFEASEVFDLILPVNDLMQALILAIPVIWIIITVIFLIVSFVNFKYLKGGYRFSAFKVFIINILCILLLGWFLNELGISERINAFFSENISTYEESVDPRYKVWNRPEEGYIAGEIVGIDHNIVKIKDLSGDIWDINIENANVRMPVNLRIGEKIKARGKALNDGIFNASDVLPWEGRRRNLQQNHM